MLKSIIISTLALATVAFAELSINSPISGTVWGSTPNQIITWISSDGTPLTGQVKIELLYGSDPNNLSSVNVLGENISAVAGSFSVQVPAGLSPSDSYAIRITDVAGAHYSHSFKINGTGAPITATSSSSASSVTPSTSANGSTSVPSTRATSTGTSNTSTFRSSSEVTSSTRSASTSRPRSSSSSSDESTDSDDSSDIDSDDEAGAIANFGFGLSASLFALCVAQLY